MTRSRTNRVHGAIACLQRLAEFLAERREQIAHAVGLSEQQWAVLEEISTEHFMPSLFARQRKRSAAAVSKILRQLLGKGLVSVQLGEKDGRQRRYELTAQGRRCIEDLRHEREIAIRKVWNGFSDDELDRFVDFGNRLVERLAAYVRERA